MSLEQSCRIDVGALPMPWSAPKRATFAWLLLMVLLWGISWPVTKLALDVVPPLWLAAIRFGSAAVCLFAFVALRKQLRFPSKRDWPIVTSIGLLQMMAFTGLGMIAMSQADTSRAVLLAYTTPIWSVLMSWLLFRKTPTRNHIAALAIGLAGIALICSPLEMDWHRNGAISGSLLLIGAAICWSFVILHIRRHQWHASPLSLAPWQMLLATVPLAGLAYGFEGSPQIIPHDSHTLMLLSFIGPVATSACFVISAEFGRRISTFAMSNFTLGVPLVGIAASVMFLGNRLSGFFVLGLTLIVFGMIFAAIASRAPVQDAGA